jgi:SAM-dependent methyltransferase
LNACLVCGSSDLNLRTELKAMSGVASDNQPWPRFGVPALCRACGHIMKLPTDQWRKDVAAIYARYRVYAAGGGKVVRVFTGPESDPRSDVLLALLCDMVPLPKAGRILDFGCGNGSFLRRFGEDFPEWTLFGHEPGTTSGILPGIEVFSDPKSLPRELNVVAMTHVLEHLEDPASTLADLEGRLSSGGTLFLAVPDLRQNPLDLAVVDHASHFTPATLDRLLRRAGWRPLRMEARRIPREILLAAQPAASREAAEDSASVPASAADLSAGLSALGWLSDTLRRAKDEAAARNGLFILGAGNAGTWLAGNLLGSVLGFADEDADRQGRTHAGLPILAPKDLPAGATVFIPFPEPMAQAITRRLHAVRPDIIVLF